MKQLAYLSVPSTSFIHTCLREFTVWRSKTTVDDVHLVLITSAEHSKPHLFQWLTALKTSRDYTNYASTGFVFLEPEAIWINHCPGGHVKAQCSFKRIDIPNYENASELLTD